MIVVFFVVTGLLSVSCNNILLHTNMLMLGRGSPEEDSLISCVLHILKKYYVSEKLLTFIEMRYDDDRLLQAVHALALLNVVHRKPINPYFSYNRAYLLTASNVTDFTQNFLYLTQEPTWNPYAKFTIVIRSIKEIELRNVFDVLLKYYVLNVLVVNGTEPFLYTYNPYEDYACGKYYNRIINFGRCPTSVDLYPNKLTTSLRRCTVRIEVPHWPPYTMHPSRIQRGMLSLGVEQMIMEIVRKKEQFNITYIYKDDGEEYSEISNQMTASGPLEMLQNNETDLMMGAIPLSPLRAVAFAYTCSHLDLADDIKIIVKTASYKPVWKFFYLEFKPIVWLFLLISLVTFSSLMILLLQIRDKIHFFLMLSGMLLQHGRIIRCRWTGKCVFIFWVWFAYLMNCFYQSNLSSVTTTPGYERQISDIKDIDLYNLKPCLSSVIKLLLMERNMTIPFDNDTDCQEFYDSIRTVSRTDEKYTIVFHSIYYYQKDLFYDEYGDNLVYTFKNKMFTVSYCMLMKKGFPFRDRLDLMMLRLRENGLIVEYNDYQYYLLKFVNRYKHKAFEARFVAPWYLYSFGLLISTIAFLAEIVSKIAFRRN